MPNWCEGRMKIRGKFSDVVSCLQNSFEGLKQGDNYVMVEAPENIKIHSKYIDSGVFEIRFNKTVYVKHSQRAIVSGGCDVCAQDKDSQTTAIIEIKQAWCIVAENFVEMSHDYNVDIRIQAFERGMEFYQDVIIEKGEITRDQTKEYQDWDWDCPVPDFGG